MENSTILICKSYMTNLKLLVLVYIKPHIKISSLAKLHHKFYANFIMFSKNSNGKFIFHKPFKQKGDIFSVWFLFFTHYMTSRTII